MFLLEESQLLEDLIEDKTVLNLYQTLHKSAPYNHRTPFVESILASDKCQQLTKVASELCDSQGWTVDRISSNQPRLSGEQKDSFCQELNLNLNDLAALTLVSAATLTQLFVIDNFTGPTTDLILESSYKNVPEIFKSISNGVNYRTLSFEGSEVYHKVVNPWILRTVQLYWSLLNSLGCSRKLLDLEFLVWKHRYLTIYHSVLLEPAESLTNELRKVQEFIFDHHIISDRENKTQLTRFNITELCCELIQSSLMRSGLTSCRKILDYIHEYSGISVEHTGVLGKRTKFQHKDIPQLMVKVSKTDKCRIEEVSHEPLSSDDLPKDVVLDDDTLLPDICFVSENGETVNQENLDPQAQLLMLAKLDLILKGEVMEESLKDEWTSAYVRAIINSAQLWPLKYKALSIRSKVEKKHTRKMDRALRQLEELIKVFEIESNVNRRSEMFYSILPPTNWQMQQSLGDISFDLGLFKNALDVYIRIEFWEGIIKCYRALEQNSKAEMIIRQELDKEKTPYLYCLLGDATENLEYYEEAWVLSKNRFARAKKSIGTHYYVRKDYLKAIENYEQALSASPTNISILFMVAYCYLTVESYEKAAECYRNITYQDDSNFLAWNNLSKAYIKLDQKERAWRTLREAIRCNYEEWKIWDNFMVVSMQIGAIDDVITAWHRLIDIKSSHKDDQMLGALTFALLKKCPKEVDSDYLKLLNEALKLVARLNSTSGCSTNSWICYYKLLLKEFELSVIELKLAGKPEPSKFDLDARVSKIVNALQRATPASRTTDREWLQLPDKITETLDIYDELVDCYSLALDILGSRPELKRQWSYFKLSACSVIQLVNSQMNNSST